MAQHKLLQKDDGLAFFLVHRIKSVLNFDFDMPRFRSNAQLLTITLCIVIPAGLNHIGREWLRFKLLRKNSKYGLLFVPFIEWPELCFIKPIHDGLDALMFRLQFDFDFALPDRPSLRKEGTFSHFANAIILTIADEFTTIRY